LTKDQLYHELNYVNATRVCRSKYAAIVLANPDLIKPLLEILFAGDKKISPRASWIFEFVIKEDYSLIFPYLDFFTTNISTLTIDSATRTCAKIIEILIDLYYKKKSKKVRYYLTQTHRERIIETSFDWLLRDEKVAVKAYSMSSLYFLGTEFEWIHPELIIILKRDYNAQSAGFKARSRHILKILDT